MIDLRMGDCLEVMKSMESNSVDSIVTDPPYGLAFMGKAWDYDVPGQNIWEECLRVLKPGGHLLAFFGTRTYHRGVIKIEDAGFTIKDQIQWIYGQGFPKSHNLKGEWQGWGCALKPANEPIVVAQKPISEDTIAKNVLKWGTGALNIDGSRIEATDVFGGGAKRGTNGQTYGAFDNYKSGDGFVNGSSQGRWPANVILDEEAAKALDEQSGKTKGNGKQTRSFHKASENTCMSGANFGHETLANYGDSGGASRFFYVAKASKSERNKGLEGLEVHRYGAGLGQGNNPEAPTTDQNFHPTVKPTKLGTYLQNLVTPPGGVTLDPFMGSGSFGVSAKLAGFQFIGIERDPDYFAIAQKRIKNAGPEVKEPDPQLEFPT